MDTQTRSVGVGFGALFVIAAAVHPMMPAPWGTILLIALGALSFWGFWPSILLGADYLFTRQRIHLTIGASITAALITGISIAYYYRPDPEAAPHKGLSVLAAAPPAPLLSVPNPPPQGVMLVLDHPPVSKSISLEMSHTREAYALDMEAGKATKISKENIRKVTSRDQLNIVSLFEYDASIVSGTIAVATEYVDFQYLLPINTTSRVAFNIVCNFDSQSLYYSAYIAESSYKISNIASLANNPLYPIKVMNDKMGFSIEPNGPDRRSKACWRFKFSGAVYIYTDAPLIDDEMEQLSQIFRSHGASPEFRSYNYANFVWDGVKDKQPPPIDLYETDGMPFLIKPVIEVNAK